MHQRCFEQYFNEKVKTVRAGGFAGKSGNENARCTVKMCPCCSGEASMDNGAITKIARRLRGGRGHVPPTAELGEDEDGVRPNVPRNIIHIYIYIAGFPVCTCHARHDTRGVRMPRPTTKCDTVRQGCPAAGAYGHRNVRNAGQAFTENTHALQGWRRWSREAA